jgi:uncharacterized membrane protein
MRKGSVGHVLFALTLAALGILGLGTGNFTPVWEPVRKSVPGRELLIYLIAAISLAGGLSLLWGRTKAIAARGLLIAFVVWLLLFRVPSLVSAPSFGTVWPVAEIAVPLAATWVLYTWFAAEWDRQHLGFVTGDWGLRIARIFYGAALVFFGLAHFIDLKDTVSLIPAWIPWHVGWAYFTGGAFIAAGLAVLTGVLAWLAAGLATVQIGLFTFLVWVPIMLAGRASAFARSETILSWALTTAAWVMADSYRSRSKAA